MAVEVQSLLPPIAPFAISSLTIKQSSSESPRDIVQNWISRFEQALNHDLKNFPELMHKDCWWRDLLSLSWDFHTLHGLDKVTSYLNANLSRAGLFNLRLRETGRFAPRARSPAQGIWWVESMFDFETNLGKGSGVLCLIQGDEGSWKCCVVSTILQSLKNAMERTGHNRPYGAERTHDHAKPTSNWKEMREKQLNFVDSEPTVVIVGAGHSGLNLAARLQQLGISTLIIDKNVRVGDNWRLRYKTLVTHDPVGYTHMPYLPFPPNWPLFTPKDKLGDWFEAYASIMELNVWTKSQIKNAEYDDATKTWALQVIRDGTERRLQPKHLVFCTGHAGEPRNLTFQGQEGFKGLVYHGSEHTDASDIPEVRNKKVVVVGTGNSGHDIAQNFCEAGAQVTMLQRRGTCVISTKVGVVMLHKGMYDEDGPPTDDADLFGQSTPIPVQFALAVGFTERIMEAEKDLHDGLTKAGFLLDFGENKDGVGRKYLTRGGGYYLDVGCSQLIIDGKIKVKQCLSGITRFKPDGLVLGDGSELDADIVVLATGYDNMRTTVRKALGDKIADRCKDVWDLDEEGEINAMWRGSGHPGFWYFGGNLALCRFYSKLLALQIKGLEDGLWQQ